ncbi:MAG: TIGR02757 family protein [Deltaproteobacteria bacterium]|nr:TIGR02757 family protein [Deltaproteobacteria bacterium]
MILVSKSQGFLRSNLDSLYAATNRREFVHPDPLEFVYRYDDPCDREVVGLVSSALAYGNVKQILKSVSGVLEKMGKNPAQFLSAASEKDLRRIFRKFYHRWHRGRHLVSLLVGIKRVLEEHGSLEKAFLKGYGPSDDTILPALSAFVSLLGKLGGPEVLEMLPPPERGSAAKRLHMYLRWMVRKDDVEPGGWDQVPPSKLVMPVDTHIHRICRKLKMTRRKQANLKTALEITEKFRKIVPDDPVKYDFVLTRFGIRDDLDYEEMIRSVAAKRTAKSPRGGNIPAPPAYQSG